MAIKPEAVTGPLATITGDLSNIFKNISDAYFGFENRAQALELLDKQTTKQAAAYTPPPTPGSYADWKTIGLSTAALILVVVVIVKAMK